MIQAFAYYHLHSLKNRVRMRLTRLKRPKYLFSALGGIAYVYFFFYRQSFSPRRAQGTPLTLDPAYFPLAEVGFTVLLFLVVLWPWLWPGTGQGILFSEAEVQFLFPAPIRRKDLLRFRIVKSQFGIAFSVMVSVLVFGRGRFIPHSGFWVITLWIVYTFVSLCRMATSLAKLSLARNGIAGFRRQVWSLGGIIAVLLSVYVWWNWFVPVAPRLESESFPAIIAWMTQVAGSGPAYYLLFPFRSLVRPAFAAGWTDFGLKSMPALIIVWLSYRWVLKGDAQFEEASLERAQKVARRLEEIRRGAYPARTLRAGERRSAPFSLSASGQPFVAIFWKNLTAITRTDLRRFNIAILVFAVALAISTGTSGTRALVNVVAGLSMAMVFFFTLLGPMMIRQDLRYDIANIETLKTLPIPGWEIVLGELLAPWVILLAIQWLLIPTAAVTIRGLRAWDHPQARLLLGLGAALLLPCFTLIGLLIQNAAVLLFPDWVQTGRAAQRGIEAMGQRLISLAATLVLILIAVVPAALIFGLTFLAGYWIIGVWVVPIASSIAAACLLVEAGLALAWLGRIFDRFDASKELLSVLETQNS
jgi:ABC-2 type transport system permease protein